MSKTKKKSAPKKETKHQPSSAELWSTALDHENAGQWSAAAEIWKRLSKTGSKKERADAAGRAAAALVRAEAQPAANDAAPAEAAPPEAPSAPEAPTAKPTRAPKPPRERDPRLPPVGTVIQKRNRNGAVRCECTVEEAGIRYGEALYTSLSGAAMAAAKDLGLANKTQNGFAFWGITRPARPSKDVLESLGRAWERYRERADAAMKGASEDDRPKLQDAIKTHAATLTALVG